MQRFRSRKCSPSSLPPFPGSLVVIALHPAIPAVRMPIAIPIERQFELWPSATDSRRHRRSYAGNRPSRSAIGRGVVRIFEILKLGMTFSLLFELGDTGSLARNILY